MPDQKRQLAAIMFTDVVGYTSLMGRDEAAAYRLLKTNRQIQKPVIEKHDGKWLKEIGDGVLASFQTISDAIYCAIEIQRKCENEPELKLRIGIHIGEVILENGDVFGDGVNIASRLEALAPAGGIYISEAVYRNIHNKKDIKAVFVREETLKNVEHPIRIYEIDVQASEVVIAESATLKPAAGVEARSMSWKRPVFIIPFAVIVLVLAYMVYNNLGKGVDPVEISEPENADKSIAVLPFVNMSNDPDQEYFSDGMMEEILSHLFQIGDLLVTSRTSVMKYKGTTKSIPEIAKELGVSTILEGSVRKSGNRVRITVQLIDGRTDKHLWAETYDKNLEDVFAIQSEVAQSIASTLQAEVQPEVRLRIESQPTENLEAYNLFLEANKIRRWDPAENKRALKILDRVIQLDPDFGRAYAQMGQRLQTGATFYATEGGMDPQKTWLITKPYFEKALTLDPNHAGTHIAIAWSLLWFEWDFEGAGIEYQKAKKIVPNYNWSDFLVAKGNFEEAVSGAEKSVEIDPTNDLSIVGLITAQYFAGYEKKVLQTIKLAMEDSSLKENPIIVLEAARIYMYLKKYREALQNISFIRTIFPSMESPRILAIQAISEYHLANRQKTMEIIDKLKEKSNDNAGGSPSFYLAMIYSEIGEIDIAFEWLEKSYQDREVEMYWLKVEPPFAPIRSDPRYQEMLAKVGFPE